MWCNTYTLLPQKGVLKLLVKKERNIISILVFILLAMVMFLYVSLFLLNVDIFIIPIISFLEGSSEIIREFLLLLTIVGIIEILPKIT